MKNDEMLLVTSKGYIINVIRRVKTPCADIIECMVKGEHKLFKVYESNKGEYIVVVCNSEYLGRCYVL